LRYQRHAQLRADLSMPEPLPHPSLQVLYDSFGPSADTRFIRHADTGTNILLVLKDAPFNGLCLPLAVALTARSAQAITSCCLAMTSADMATDAPTQAAIKRR